MPDSFFIAFSEIKVIGGRLKPIRSLCYPVTDSPNKHVSYVPTRFFRVLRFIFFHEANRIRDDVSLGAFGFKKDVSRCSF